MREIKAPEFFDPIRKNYNKTWNKLGLMQNSVPQIFLAGSIEMGKAELWQDRAVKMFNTWDCIVLNPRRDDWDSSWKQSKDDPKFLEQVTWEQVGLAMSDVILFYFDPETQSPITLMELGLVAGLGKDAVVVCPEGFYRKGNVDILCDRFDLVQFDTLEKACIYIREEYLN